MEVEPVEKSPTRSIKSDSSPSDSLKSLGNIFNFVTSTTHSDALQRGQASVKKLINALKGQIEEPPLAKIKDVLQQLLNRAAVPSVPPPLAEPGPKREFLRLSSGVLGGRFGAVLWKQHLFGPAVKNSPPIFGVPSP